MSLLSDPKFWISLQNKDPDSWSAFFDLVAPKLKTWVKHNLWKYGFHKNMDPEVTAEDVVSGAFTKAWESIHQYDANRPIMPWFRTIVVNKLNDEKRELERRSFKEVSVKVGDRDTLEDSQIMDTEMAEALCRNINLNPSLLSEKDLLYLKWFFIDGYPSKEISELLGVTDAAVRKAKQRLLIKLRQLLQNVG